MEELPNAVKAFYIEKESILNFFKIIGMGEAKFENYSKVLHFRIAFDGNGHIDIVSMDNIHFGHENYIRGIVILVQQIAEMKALLYKFCSDLAYNYRDFGISTIKKYIEALEGVLESYVMYCEFLYL